MLQGFVLKPLIIFCDILFRAVNCCSFWSLFELIFDPILKVKAFLADPTAFAAVAAPVAAAETAATPAAAKEEVKEESEESDGDMGFGLFD